MNNEVVARAGQLDNKIRAIAWALGAFALAMLVIVLLPYFLFFRGGLSQDQSIWGQFGDFVGGSLNPLFSLITLIAILFTLIIQSRELSFSSTALKEQSDSLRIQSFENTFFSMLRMNLETKNTLDLEDTEEDKTVGRVVFRKVYERLRYSYRRVSEEQGTGQDELEICREAYRQFYRKNQWFIGAYLRTLEEIFTFISDRCPENASQESYWPVVRAQLSDFELLLLFYHCLCLDEAVDIMELQSHKLFKFLPTDQLLNRNLHVPFLDRG